MKKAFTLIELLMVIAIIGIISTLAVNKVGGVREASARKVSLANQIAVERAVESFLSDGNNRLNRLDSLVSTQGDTTKEWNHGGHESSGCGFDCTYTNFVATKKELYLGPVIDVAGVSADDFRMNYNAGVAPELQEVVCPYQLVKGQAEALINRLGLRYVMAHNEYACDPADKSAYGDRRCADGTYVESRGDEGKNPNESGCVAIAVTNGMTVFAVNPVVERGRAIYRACGQELMRTEKDGAQYDEDAAVARVYATGGPLVVLGLGDAASIVGKANSGLESAPFATYPPRYYYSRYILLIRLRTVGGSVIPEFAGVLDPCGNTIRSAREIVRSL